MTRTTIITGETVPGVWMAMVQRDDEEQPQVLLLTDAGRRHLAAMLTFGDPAQLIFDDEDPA